MSSTTKILLAIATGWPFLYLLFFFAFVLTSVFYLPTLGPGAGDDLGPLFALIFVMHLGTMLLIMGLLIFYIVNVFRNEHVDKDKRVLWAVVLFFGGIVAMPVYWYLYIWPEKTIAPADISELTSGDDFAPVNDPRYGTFRDGVYVPPPEPPNWRDED